MYTDNSQKLERREKTERKGRKTMKKGKKNKDGKVRTQKKNLTKLAHCKYKKIQTKLLLQTRVRMITIK